jgi:hypothetical protein
MRKLFGLLVVLLMMSQAVLGQQNITFGWDLPTENTNGTPITDLDVCRLYSSTNSGSYVFGSGNEILEVPASTNAPVGVVTNTGSIFVQDGTYYFVITAVDASGNESGPSNELQVDISVTPNPPVLRLAMDYNNDGDLVVSVIIETMANSKYSIAKTYSLENGEWIEIASFQTKNESEVELIYNINSETNKNVFFKGILMNCISNKKLDLIYT